LTRALTGIAVPAAARKPLISIREPQLLDDGCPITSAVEALSNAGIEQRGAVFTKPEVVGFLLDLIGYTPDQPLTERRLLEPSCGEGDFLLPALDRLLQAWRRTGQQDPYPALKDALRAVELHRTSHDIVRRKVLARLEAEGFPKSTCLTLADAWLIFGDFLLIPLEMSFDAVVGNPPYVRQELIAAALMNEYRARYQTIYDRADIYIPFIERSLSTLTDSGRLGFICSDRWMKNRYGGPLRKLVADRYHLSIYVDMVDTPAFLSDVIAYPAITVITRRQSASTRIARRPAIETQALASLTRALLSERRQSASSGVTELEGVASGSEPWLLESSAQLPLVRRLEAAFPILEDAGCKVGIGVATGADRAFIGPFAELDVEPDRKLPLVMTRDIEEGTVGWRGLGVINPFGADGCLVALTEYPRLKAYLEARRDDIEGRHVARKAPANWFRTIDRIYPELAARPKLLIPDIKGEAHVVYESEGLYPHHNLYFVISDDWDLRALQAVLLSAVSRLFVATYSTKMRGGYLRFQAQYLRRIRLPLWSTVSPEMRTALADAAQARDIAACNRAAFALYRLTESEVDALGGIGR
jgi:hypothetical protein